MMPMMPMMPVEYGAIASYAYTRITFDKVFEPFHLFCQFNFYGFVAAIISGRVVEGRRGGGVEGCQNIIAFWDFCSFAFVSQSPIC